MKLKTFIIIIIIVTTILPSTLAQLQESESVFVVNCTDKTLNIWYDFEVRFCYGQVSNAELRHIGYGWFGCIFTAVNVICRNPKSTLPLFRRFSNNERIAVTYPGGIITNDVIFVISGLWYLFPLKL
jgi:hypothetical protein